MVDVVWLSIWFVSPLICLELLVLEVGIFCCWFFSLIVCQSVHLLFTFIYLLLVCVAWLKSGSAICDLILSMNNTRSGLVEEYL